MRRAPTSLERWVLTPWMLGWDWLPRCCVTWSFAQVSAARVLSPLLRRWGHLSFPVWAVAPLFVLVGSLSILNVTPLPGIMIYGGDPALWLKVFTMLLVFVAAKKGGSECSSILPVAETYSHIHLGMGVCLSCCGSVVPALLRHSFILLSAGWLTWLL